MSYSSRSKHSTSSAWLAAATAVTAALAAFMLAGCNPFGGSTTTVVVPKAKPATSVEATIPFVIVPDVTTLDVQDAQNRLLDEGLLFNVRWHRSSTVPAFEVYKQNPEPSDEVTPGTYVTIYASIGTQAQLAGMKTNAAPKPRKPKWTSLSSAGNAWLLTGVGSGTSPAKTFDGGWLHVSGLVSIPIRVRLNHPDGEQNIMVDTTHAGSHDVRLTVGNGIREDQVRIGRVVQAEGGGYKVLVRCGWNQPWVVLVRWSCQNKRGDSINPPIWP